MLYIVATPIGNLADVSVRILNTLKKVDIVAAEDTRMASKLLGLLGISGKECIALHQHSGGNTFLEVRKLLEAGKDVALITDAGTPGIADPGGEIVAYITAHCPDVAITAVPGPSAVVTALSISGFPADEFVFLGFPPHKKKRTQFFKRVRILSQEMTVVLFESNHRITKTVSELATVLPPEQKIMIGRELTKHFESVIRTTAGELSTLDIKEKGEFVIVICQNKKSST